MDEELLDPKHLESEANETNRDCGGEKGGHIPFQYLNHVYTVWSSWWMDFTQNPWPTVGPGGNCPMAFTHSKVGWRNVAVDLFTQNVNTQTYKALNTWTALTSTGNATGCTLPLVLSLLMLGTLLNLGSPKGIVVPTWTQESSIFALEYLPGTNTLGVEKLVRRHYETIN